MTPKTSKSYCFVVQIWTILTTSLSFDIFPKKRPKKASNGFPYSNKPSKFNYFSNFFIAEVFWINVVKGSLDKPLKSVSIFLNAVNQPLRKSKFYYNAVTY